MPRCTFVTGRAPQADAARARRSTSRIRPGYSCVPDRRNFILPIRRFAPIHARPCVASTRPHIPPYPACRPAHTIPALDILSANPTDHSSPPAGAGRRRPAPALWVVALMPTRSPCLQCGCCRLGGGPIFAALRPGRQGGRPPGNGNPAAALEQGLRHAADRACALRSSLGLWAALWRPPRADAGHLVLHRAREDALGVASLHRRGRRRGLQRARGACECACEYRRREPEDSAAR